MSCGCSSEPNVASDEPNRVASAVLEESVPEESYFTYITKLRKELADLKTLKSKKKGGSGVELRQEQKLRLEELRQLLNRNTLRKQATKLSRTLRSLNELTVTQQKDLEFVNNEWLDVRRKFNAKHNPKNNPKSNAQKLENIQRRHDLEAKKMSVGLTPTEEKELSDLYDRLEAYDKDSENRAEHRALWDKFFTNDEVLPPTEFDRLKELNLKFRVEWTNLVFPNSLNAKVKEFVRCVPLEIRNYLYDRVMLFCMRMDQVEGRGPNEGPHKGRAATMPAEFRLFSSSPGFKDTFNCIAGMGPELKKIISYVLQNMATLFPNILPTDDALISKYLNNLQETRSPVVFTHIVSYAEYKSLYFLAPLYANTIIAPGLCIEFWKKYLVYYCLREGFPVIPLRFRSLFAILMRKATSVSLDQFKELEANPETIVKVLFHSANPTTMNPDLKTYKHTGPYRDLKLSFFNWVTMCANFAPELFPGLSHNSELTASTYPSSEDWDAAINKQLIAPNATWFKKHITGSSGPFRCNFAIIMLKVNGSEPSRATVEELVKTLYGEAKQIKRTKIPVWAFNELETGKIYKKDILSRFVGLCRNQGSPPGPARMTMNDN